MVEREAAMSATVTTPSEDVQPSFLAYFGRSHHGQPFERPGLLHRILPFAVVTAFAEASLALSPRSVSLGYAILSVALLCAVAAGLFLPWHRLPPRASVLVLLADVAFVLTLILATGNPSSGVGIVILIPLIWASLYHQRWEAFVTVAAIVATEVVTSLTPVQVADAVLLRKVVFWVAIGMLLSVATYALRDTQYRSLTQRETSLRLVVSLAAASGQLTTLLDPEEVLAEATRLAATLASPAGTPGRRAQYNRVHGETVQVVAQYDDTGQAITEPFALTEQPNLVEVIRADVTMQLPVDPERAGPKIAELVRKLGVTSSIYIPVHRDGAIDGILSVPLRGTQATQDLVDFYRAFGHFVELALGNAHVHAALEESAVTDNLTNLPNRRAFDQLVEKLPGRARFSMMAIDLDGLKEINDTLGHAAGDRMLIFAAHAMQVALRHGDVVARIGGDEFAVFLHEANQSDAAAVGERMLRTVGMLPSGSPLPRFSVGIATGEPGSDPREVLRSADRAMYEAKRGGGGQLAFAEPRRLSETPGSHPGT